VTGSARCTCGVVHADETTLAAVGWKALGGGVYGRLATCRVCDSLIAIEVRDDACICEGCRRLVTGDVDDPMVVAEVGTFCVHCSRTCGIAA
jgi:hypothetical protein